MLPTSMETSRVIRRTLAFAGVGAVAGLVVFHAGLFWAQFAAGRLREPQVALRWLAAALVLGLSLHHRRAGATLLRSRRGLVLCVVVALLHGNAATPAEVDAGAAAGVTEALLALPATSVPLALSLGLALALLAAMRSGLVPSPELAFASLPRPSFARLLAPPSSCLSPRPPPA
jgi:hypothetical protein